MTANVSTLRRQSPTVQRFRKRGGLKKTVRQKQVADLLINQLRQA